MLRLVPFNLPWKYQSENKMFYFLQYGKQYGWDMKTVKQW